jgi:hypothetical protein
MAYLATPTSSVTLDDCILVSTASHPAPHQLWITATLTTYPHLTPPSSWPLANFERSRAGKIKHLLQLEFCIICRISIPTPHCRRQDAYPEKRHLFLSHVATTSLSFFCLVLSYPSVFFSLRHGAMDLFGMDRFSPGAVIMHVRNMYNESSIDKKNGISAQNRKRWEGEEVEDK